jgi:DNA invertase Pin-like site-specific DNA recombinase
MKRVAIYVRSSPDCSLTADEQISQLSKVAAERGWMVAHLFADGATSVKKSQDRRPGELALIGAIRAKAINRVLIWSIDRVGKCLVDLIGFIEICRSAHVALNLYDEGFDSETSNGLSLFDVSALLAHHLRQSRRDRILRGQAAARALSIRFGRPPIAKPKVEKAKQFLASGKGVRQVAKMAGISPASVSRIKTSMTGDVTRI